MMGLRGIPEDEGVASNEMVDRHAEDAAQAESLPPKKDNRYIRLVLATKRRFRQEILIERETAWASERVCAATRLLIEAPTRKVLEYYVAGSAQSEIVSHAPTLEGEDLISMLPP